MSPASPSVPRHVAIIMDGNGRWAQNRGHLRSYGHVRGAKRVKDIVRAASDAGVDVITFFAFSTENWKRPESELDVLWKLLDKFIDKEIVELDARNVRFRAIGEIERLRPSLQKKIRDAEARLAKNTGIRMNFAISYGGRLEIAQAARRFSEDCMAGRARPEDLTEERLERYLWTDFLGELSNVDLMIRTSGEQRTSNFLLWQSAYSEFVFTDVLWPDFHAEQFLQALQEFGARARRFGGVSVGLKRTVEPAAKPPLKVINT